MIWAVLLSIGGLFLVCHCEHLAKATIKLYNRRGFGRWSDPAAFFTLWAPFLSLAIISLFI